MKIEPGLEMLDFARLHRSCSTKKKGAKEKET